jgi:hypothetical protein
VGMQLPYEMFPPHSEKYTIKEYIIKEMSLRFKSSTATVDKNGNNNENEKVEA